MWLPSSTRAVLRLRDSVRRGPDSPEVYELRFLGPESLCCPQGVSLTWGGEAPSEAESISFVPSCAACPGAERPFPGAEHISSPLQATTWECLWVLLRSGLEGSQCPPQLRGRIGVCADFGMV